MGEFSCRICLVKPDEQENVTPLNQKHENETLSSIFTTVTGFIVEGKLNFVNIFEKIINFSNVF